VDHRDIAATNGPICVYDNGDVVGMGGPVPLEEIDRHTAKMALLDMGYKKPVGFEFRAGFMLYNIMRKHK
jgi:hypothetical protein